MGALTLDWISILLKILCHYTTMINAIDLCIKIW